MSTNTSELDLPLAPALGQAARSWFWRRLWPLVLLCLTLQSSVFQFITYDSKNDSPRNLHWGIYMVERPAFLLDGRDDYDRVSGFAPPDPSMVSQKNRVYDTSGIGYLWWGPLYISTFAGLWWLTESQTVLRLFVPLLAGVLVLMTYAFGKRYFSRRIAAIAVVFMALFPPFREYATMAFVEPISALLLLGALWAFLEQRTLLTVLCGSLAILGKIDMIQLYFGLIGLLGLLSLRDPARPFSRRHLSLSLVLPLLVLVPWVYIAYGVYQRPLVVSDGPNLVSFQTLAPLMFDAMFLISWKLALGVLVVLGLCIYYGRRNHSTQPLIFQALLIWLFLGLIVFVVYMATPGARHVGRIFIPALPALSLLVAAGIDRLSASWRWPLLAAILALFLYGNFIVVKTQQLPRSSKVRAALPLWSLLRDQPRGYVLSDFVWDPAFFALQPVTWFAQDKPYKKNILENVENFKRYTMANPIRYVVIPVNFHMRVVGPEVHNYLLTHFQHHIIGEYILVVLY